MVDCYCFPPDQKKLNDAINWSLEKLKTALSRALRQSQPMHLLDGLPINACPMDYVGDIHDMSDNKNFRARFHMALLEMFTAFEITERPASKSDCFYMTELITSLPWFKVPEAGDEIRRKILSKKYMNVPDTPYGLPLPAYDLQAHLLHALLDYPDDRNLPVYKTFFPENNGVYANMCYRGLWETDRQYGIAYMPQLATFYHENKEMPGHLSTEFGFFLEKNFMAFVQEDFDAIKQRCKNNMVFELIQNGVNRFFSATPWAEEVRIKLESAHCFLHSASPNP